MKSTFTFVLVTVMLRYNQTLGFRLKINDSNGNNEIEEVNNSGGDGNNTNNDVIKVENNQSWDEIEKISRAGERREQNFKLDLVPRLSSTPLHDQFYENAENNTGRLGGIGDEEIASYEEKLANVFDGIGTLNSFQRESREAVVNLPNEIDENTWRLMSKIISNPYELFRIAFLGKTYKERPEILKGPIQSPRPKRQNNYVVDINEDHLNSSESPKNLMGNEQSHISNIKNEISKLQSLVKILKDQQSILNLLDDEASNDTIHVNTFESVTNPSESINTKWIESGIDDLNRIENEGGGSRNGFELSLHKLSKDLNATKARLSELNYLFEQQVLSKLNGESASRKKMKIYFEKALAEQKEDLLKMKRVILNLFKKLLGNNGVNTSAQHNVSEDVGGNEEFKAILKELKNIEENISVILNERSFKNDIVQMNPDKSGTGSIETSVEEPSAAKARMTSAEDNEEIEDDLDDLLEALETKKASHEKINGKKLNDLLKELEQSDNGDSFEFVSKELNSKLSKTDEIKVTEALMGLVKLLDKNFDSETKANRILNRFRKTLNSQTKNKKSDDRMMAEALRRLLNKAQSKNFDSNVDDGKDVMARLQELSGQIDKLQQKDDAGLEMETEEENRNFESLLQRLINKEEHSKLEEKLEVPKLKLTKNEIDKLIAKLTSVPKKTTKNLFDYKNAPLTGKYKCEIVPSHNEQYSGETPENSRNLPTYPLPSQYIYDNHQNWHEYHRYPVPNYVHIPSRKYEIIPTPNNRVFDQNYHQPHPVTNLFRDYHYEGAPISPVQFKNPPNFEEIRPYFDTSHTAQYSLDTPEDSTSNVQEKIEQLKGQLNSLGTVISSLGRPEYGQTQDGMKSLDELNEQISYLKYVIDGLSNESNLKHYDNFEEIKKGESYRDIHNNNGMPYTSKDQNYQLNYLGENRNFIKNQELPYNNPIQSPIREASIQPGHAYAGGNLIMPPRNELEMPNPAASKVEIKKNSLNRANSLESNTKVLKTKRATNQSDSERLRYLLVRLLEDGVEDDKTLQDDNLEDFDKQNDLEPYDENDNLPESARSSMFNVNQRRTSEKRLKKFDIFDKILSKILDKILDKVEIAIPRIIERLFGLTQFYTNKNYGYGNNVMQIFRNFGITGYIPLIILKGLYSLNFLINELQRNPFAKNFLVPFGIVGFVAAATVFLIYWLQPNYYQSGQNPSYQIQPYNSYGQHGSSQYSNPHAFSGYNDYTNNKLYPWIPWNNYKSNAYNNYYNKRNMYRNVYPSGYD